MAEAAVQAARDTRFSTSRVSVAMGARVEGIDLARDTDAQLVSDLHDLLLEHHLLVLPGQTLSALELADFGRLWGSLLTHPATKHEDTEFVQWIAREGRKHRFFPGEHPFGSGWHSDMTWHSTPPRITALHARVLPPVGGDTAFSNQHLAYDTLDEALRKRIEGLEAFHSGKVFGPDVEDSVHPVVRTHEETGRRALYVNSTFTRHMVGLPEDESERLLFRLLAHASRPEFVYRHRWDVDDLVMWDNRSVMHYAVADFSEERVMHRIVVQGGKPR